MKTRSSSASTSLTGRVVSTFTGIESYRAPYSPVAQAVPCLIAEGGGLSEEQTHDNNRRRRSRAEVNASQPHVNRDLPTNTYTEIFTDAAPPHRTWTAMSIEESKTIADSLGVPEINPADYGVNLFIQGIPNFSKLPNGTILSLGSTESLEQPADQNVRLCVFGPNHPNHLVGVRIAYNNRDIKDSAIAEKFLAASSVYSGLIGKVLSDGIITPGDEVTVQLPTYMFSSDLLRRHVNEGTFAAYHK